MHVCMHVYWSMEKNAANTQDNKGVLMTATSVSPEDEPRVKSRNLQGGNLNKLVR